MASRKVRLMKIVLKEDRFFFSGKTSFTREQYEETLKTVRTKSLPNRKRTAAHHA